MNAVTGTIRIGRNVFGAIRDTDGSVVYRTAKGEKIASAKIAKLFVETKISDDLAALEAETEALVKANAEVAELADMLNSSPTVADRIEARKADETQGLVAAVDQAIAKENAKPAAKPSKAPVEVKDEDIRKLVFVASHQKSPKVKHLDNCPHFEGKAKFVKAEAVKLAQLKPCPDCSRTAARTRVASSK